MQIAVLGAGAWGSALAIEYAHDHQVKLWARNAIQAQQMQINRENKRYLNGFLFPTSIEVSSNLSSVIKQAELIFLVTPIAGLRQTLRALKNTNIDLPPLILACKGFEKDRGLLAHNVVEEELPKFLEIAILAGPSFARELALGLPTAVTIASTHKKLSEDIVNALNNQRLRLYASNDLIGVEVGSTVKNVIAIACGIADGLGFGSNSRAALMTRGLAETTRLALAMGGKSSTMMGLSGMGDLLLTCTGDLSRNRQVGLKLSKSIPIEQILNDLGHVAEGVASAYEVKKLANKYSISMPITESVCQLLDGKVKAQELVAKLMSREPKLEIDKP